MSLRPIISSWTANKRFIVYFTKKKCKQPAVIKIDNYLRVIKIIHILCGLISGYWWIINNGWAGLRSCSMTSGKSESHLNEETEN